VVSIALPACCLVASLHLKGVVISGEAGIRSGTPFHLDGEAWSACFAAIGAAEVDRIDPARQAASRHGPSQTSQEDFVVARDGNYGDPGICTRVEGGRSASGARRESNLRIGNRK
jgi:hypothetical protein